MPTEYDNFRQMRYDKVFIIRKEKVAYMDKMDKAMEGVLEYLKHKENLRNWRMIFFLQRKSVNQAHSIARRLRKE